jgi:hypothetical protein
MEERADIIKDMAVRENYSRRDICKMVKPLKRCKEILRRPLA